MARRTGLREFQISVAERIRTASSRAALSSKLGFQVGADNWFVALHQVNEVIPVPPMLPGPAVPPGAPPPLVVPRRGNRPRQPLRHARLRGLPGRGADPGGHGAP